MIAIRVSRLIGIITILLQKDKVTAPFLAEKFEVSRRTINRDIEDICKAGIPITTTQGYDGGISIAEGYKIDKTVFTTEEIESIFIGLKSLHSISRGSHIYNVINKFSSGKDVVLAESGNILIDLSSHYKSTLTEKIEVVKEAINEQKLISFRYYYNKGEADKIIEPYLLVFRWSDWYVFGYCIERQGFRLFKLNRLWSLECKEECFKEREIPKEKMEFDRYFSDEIQLIALFDEHVKYRLVEEYGVDSFSYAESGKLMFKMGFTRKENLLSWILSFGDAVEIIEPEELILELKEQVRNIVKKYKRT